MTTVNDTKLKTLLAKMLPETVRLGTLLTDDLFWIGKRGGRILLLDTELLQLCDLAEQTLTEVETMLYEDALANEHSGGFARVRYTWQQRVTALAAVKGITL
jgi:hypothetical protein